MKKADLHMHPHFYSPQSGKRVPSLKNIVNFLFGTGLDICALSACHPMKGESDRRFDDYMEELSSLEGDYGVDYHADEGFLRLRKKIPLCMESSEMIILNSQEIRTAYNNMPADINVIGIPGRLEAGKDTLLTINAANDLGGIISSCHPDSPCGLKLDDAISMSHNSGGYRIHTIEGWDATADEATNKRVSAALTSFGRRWNSVSDAHHYTQAGAAYSVLDIEGDFTIDKFREAMIFRDIENHPGQVGFLSRHYYHTLPILASIPGHLLRNPRYILKALSKRK